MSENIRNLTEEVVALSRNGKLQDAELLCKKIISIEKSNIFAHVNLANVLFMRGDIGSAIEEYKYAQRLNPKDCVIKENLSLALTSAGLFDEALKEINELLEISPRNGSAYNLLGNIFFYKKDFVTARKHYEEAVKINPQLCDPWNNLGNICFEQGDFIKAEEFYSNAVRCSPNNPYFHGGLGKALLKQDKLDLAIASYKKALEINPNLSDIKKVLINIYIILGERQQQSGDMEKACEYFQEATKIDNQNVLLYNKIAGIKLMLNDYVGACSVYETCKKNCKDIDLSKYPNFSRFQL